MQQLLLPVIPSSAKIYELVQSRNIFPLPQRSLSRSKRLISLVSIYGEKLQLIVDITNEAKRWESMPNRREPLTKDMLTFLIKKSATLNLPDGKYAVMTDWFILALQAGFRRMEWS